MITLETPDNLIIQRDTTGRAVLPIKGKCDRNVTSITVDLTPVKSGWGTALTATLNVYNGTFSDSVTAKTGWYLLTLKNDASETITQKIGVGEVFMVTGHSIASNNGRGYPDDLPIGERVMTLDFLNDRDSEAYNKTLDSARIPFRFVPVSVTKQLPINSDPQHWGNMAHRLSEQLNCPVLVMNCAYGGSALEMWSKGIKNQKYGYFDNPDGERAPGQIFNWEKPLPYGTMKQMMENVISKTGLRAVLSHHGENDRTPADTVAGYYKDLIEASRNYAPGVAWVICRSSVAGRNADNTLNKLTDVRQAQEKVIATVPKCFPGPDYDAKMNDLKPGVGEVLALTPADRYDDLHLSVTGLRKAAGLWGDAVTQQINFFEPFTPVKPEKLTDTPDEVLVPDKYTNPSVGGKVEQLTGLKWPELGLIGVIMAAVIVYAFSSKK